MVYVDTLQICLNDDAFQKKWKYSHYCHLFSDDVAALHEFAARIKLKRQWFQNLPGFPHYDLTLRMRGAALANGAQSVTRREMVRLVRAWRGLPAVENSTLQLL